MGQQYVTKADLCERYGEIEIGDMSNHDDKCVEAAIVSVSAIIDSFVAPRYRLPLKNRHEVLKAVACDMVYYKLQTIRPSEESRKNFEDAMDILSKISAGRMTLNEPTGEESRPVSRIAIKTTPRKFTQDMWGDF